MTDKDKLIEELEAQIEKMKSDVIFERDHSLRLRILLHVQFLITFLKNGR